MVLTSVIAPAGSRLVVTISEGFLAPHRVDAASEGGDHASGRAGGRAGICRHYEYIIT